MGENVFVLMPAYNAGATIERLFARIPSEARQRIRRYVAVNDGSRDDTAASAGSSGAGVSEPGLLADETNRGYGEAEKTLLRYTLKKGADIGILLHSDRQYSPEKIPELLAPWLRILSWRQQRALG